MDIQNQTISIIIPIYKVEAYLRRCVDSILAQTYPDFELILVDDGSPDNCGVICDQYAAQDARIRVIHKENGGLSDARNAGLQIAKGEYVAFVDSDDWVTADYLEKLLNALTETGADICECSILRTASEEGQIIYSENSSAKVYNTVEALQQLIHDGVFHQYVWNKLYRRNVIADILFPKGKTNEDEFWTYQVFGNATKVAKIQNVLYFYFQRPGSIMGENYSLKRLDALEAKLQRQKYIEANFPQLSLQAKQNLFGSCIYAGQMSMLHLDRDQLAKAKTILNEIVQKSGLSIKDCLSVSGSNSVWFSMATVSFWNTCRIKNLFKKGF